MANKKSITIRNVPDEVHEKYAHVRKLIEGKSLMAIMIPAILEEGLDRFIKNPDVKKYLK